MLSKVKEWILERRSEDGSDELGLVIDIFVRYFRRFRGKYFLIFICIALTSGTTAFIAWFMRDIVNSLFAGSGDVEFSSFLAAICIVFFIKGASAYFQTVLSTQIGNAMVADLQQRLYQHILKQRVSFFEKNSTDTLLMLFNQGTSGISSIMNILITRGAADAATLIGLIALMIWTDWQLTIIAGLGGPLVFIGVSRILKKVKEIAQLELAGFQVLYRHVRETVQGIGVVKSYNLEEKLETDTSEVIKSIEERKNKMAALQAMPIPLLDTVGGLAIGGVILFAGYRISTGATDLGTTVSYLTALLLAADPARRLSQMRVGLRRSLNITGTVYRALADDRPDASGDKVYEDVVDPAPPAPPSIAFEKIDFAYNETDAPVLQSASFDVAPGEMAALVGPSGAGKSTAVGLALKFLRPKGGRILIGGADAAEIETHELRRHIAYVGQSSFIFHGSMYDNLALDTQDVSREQAYEACKMVGLAPFVDSLPEGLDSLIGEGAAGVSGGQAQRLNIARAILRDAPIMLLDEVTSALDAENEQLIKDYVLAQRGKKTILAIAHRLSTVRGADKIVLLDKGRVLDVGPHDELVERNEYYAKVVSLQFV